MAILAAGALVLFVTICAAAYDVGQILTVRRHLQNAADAAVLAGVQELDCTNNSSLIASAETVAEQYATKNVSQIQSNVATADATTVRSVVTREARGLLPQLFGFDVEADATAEVTCTSESGAAIWAGADACNKTNLVLSGSDLNITGTVHSDGGITAGGSNLEHDGELEYGHDCSPSDGDEFDPVPPPTFLAKFSDPPDAIVPGSDPKPPYPIDRVPLDNLLNNPVNCTFRFSGGVNLTSGSTTDSIGKPFRSGNTLLAGTYCANGKLEASGQDIVGDGVSFLTTGEVAFSGSNFNFNQNAPPAVSGVLIYSNITEKEKVDISGSGGQWNGAIFAPTSGVKMQGSGNISLSGSLIGDTVSVSGQGMNLTGSGGSGGLVKRYALTE